jgi:hypothetical protein
MIACKIQGNIGKNIVVKFADTDLQRHLKNNYDSAKLI